MDLGIINKIIDSTNDNILTDSKLFALLEENSFDFSNFENLLDELQERNIIIKSNLSDEKFDDHHIISSITENENDIENWLEIKSFTFQDLDSILCEAKSKNIKCEIATAFVLYVIKKLFIDEIKQNYKNISDYAKIRLNISKSYTYKLIGIAERFIRIKDINMAVGLYNVMSIFSYNVYSDMFGNSFKCNQLVELLSLSDEKIKELVDLGIVHTKMTTKEIQTKVLSINIPDKIQNCVLKIPVLKMGDSGNTVMRLQQILIADKITGGQLIIDGYFGINTENALKSYQRNHSINETGICDVETWKKLLL